MPVRAGEASVVVTAATVTAGAVTAGKLASDAASLTKVTGGSMTTSGGAVGIGTASLVAMGCIMVRQCQSNTCPVGVCTQDEKLRAKFTGSADKVVNLITFYAQEVREILAQIGARSMDEIIGRADLLTQVSRGAANLDDLDLNPLLITVDGASKICAGLLVGDSRNDVQGECASRGGLRWVLLVVCRKKAFGL